MPPPLESQIVLLVGQKAAGSSVEPGAERECLAVGVAVLGFVAV